MIEDQFDILINVRKSILKIVDGLTMEQVNTIPTGFRNNIAWNLAHVVVTQQLLCYKLAGQDCLIPDAVVNDYRKGAMPDPSLPMSAEMWEQCKVWMLEMVDALQKDYAKGIFTSYHEYMTSAGVNLTSIDKAIAFNNFHEGLHLGYIQALKRSI